LQEIKHGPAANRRIDLEASVPAAQAREREVAAAAAARQARLPLRYWRQQAHYTAPPADAQMARKAIEEGTAPMARILERFSVSTTELADALEVPEPSVAELVEHPRRAPLVMLDGEDAQALRQDVIDRGLSTGAALLQTAAWADEAGATLRFFRVPGFNLSTTARDLLTLLDKLAEGANDEPLPIDGIVFPKVEHPEHVDLLYGHLDQAERELGLPAGTIRVGLQVESGGAILNLQEIVRRAAPRLSSLILGLVDFSADVRLPQLKFDHPVIDVARAMVVIAAGAAGVPAIDAMTVEYPVADVRLDVPANRARFLERMRLIHSQATQARTLGMAGKWVGHPAQLFAAKLEEYRAAVDVDAKGATIIDGVMSDRATDRHARHLLRQAVALGRFSPERAVLLGVIDERELAELATSSSGGRAHR